MSDKQTRLTEALGRARVLVRRRGKGFIVQANQLTKRGASAHPPRLQSTRGYTHWALGRVYREEKCLGKLDPKAAKRMRLPVLGATGRRRGTLVDDEVSELCERMAAAPHHQILNPCERVDECDLCSWVVESIKTWHPFTLQFAALLEEQKLTPVASQVAVGNARACATAIDVLARSTETGAIHILELKCGFRDRFETQPPRKRLLSPLADTFKDFPLARAAVQVFMQAVLLDYTYEHVDLETLVPMVVNVHERGACVYDVREVFGITTTDMRQRLRLMWSPAADEAAQAVRVKQMRVRAFRARKRQSKHRRA